MPTFNVFINIIIVNEGKSLICVAVWYLCTMLLLHCDTDLHWFVGVCAWDLSLFLLSQTFKYPFFFSKRWTVRRWKKPRASSCRRGIISRKQACQPTERCDVHTERFSMHVLLQAEWRRRHLKQNFKWRHERRRQEAPKSSMGCWCVRCPGVCVCNFMSSYVYAHWMT